nr:DUF4347 domain-containing protein [Pseudoduganella lutea]
MTTSLLILDSRVAASYVPTSVPTGMRLVILDPAVDGLEQVAAAVAGEQTLAAIHIVSHGAPGILQLGGTEVSLATLAGAAGPLARIGASLASDGDLLLYGCNVGESEAGAAFLATLAGLTGADVAASTDLSGPTAAGGNWALERGTGTIEARTLADDGFGTLALVTGTTDDDVLGGPMATIPFAAAAATIGSMRTRAATRSMVAKATIP